MATHSSTFAMDGAAWWAAVYGVTQSRTLLKWLSSSRLVITFLPRSKHLLISWLKSLSAVTLEPPKNKVCHRFHCFLIYLPWSGGTECHDLCFFECWILSQLFHSSFTFIKRLFSCSSLFPITVVSSAYLRLLIFYPAILIPACDSSSLSFCMIRVHK